MYENYEDYYEPDQFEELKYEFEKKLFEMLDPKFQEELESLRKDKTDLITQNALLKSQKSGLERQLEDLDKYKKQILDDIKKNQMKWFKENISITLYKAVSVATEELKYAPFSQKVKLDNGDTVIIYNKTASHTVTDYEKKKQKYVVKEVQAICDRFEKGYRNYYINGENDSFDSFSSGSICDEFSKGMQTYRAHFTSYDECEKLCEYLNAELEEKYKNVEYFIQKSN
jgi:hypothetical protein